MNPNPWTDSRNRNYLISGIAALVAVIAFFLPFVAVSYSSTYGSYSSSANGSVSGILWLCELLMLAVVAASALLMFRPHNPFGITTTPLANQIRWVAFGVIGAGGLSLLISFFSMLNVTSTSSSLTESSGFSVSWGIGAILFLLASIVVTVGGVMMVMNKTIGGGAASYAASQSPYQNNPYAQQSQYPPAGYPPQQPPSYPGGYPQSTQYPPQPQYPPTQYPPQQPPQYPQQ